MWLAAEGARRVDTRRPHQPLAFALALLAITAALSCSSRATAGSTPRQADAAAIAAGDPRVHHYEYVFPDGAMYVYDIDAHFRLVRRVSLPMARGIRGVVASPRTHRLYISYGGDGGGNGDGSLLCYDLLSGRVLWERHLSSGVDSMAITPDGRRIYMPSGELDNSGVWYVLAAGDGHVLATIYGGAGAHNTVMSLDGRHAYLGGRNSNYLDVAGTATNRVIGRIGPLRSGVRPFTINGSQTLAFTTATGFLGFQVSSVASGRVLFTETFPGFGWSPSSFAPSAPSHGISLSPNERQVWVIDAPNSTVHAFDVAGLPRRAPRLLANIRLTQPMSGDEQPCTYDCARDGWLQHTRDGRYVLVGDSGDVIATKTFRVTAYLPALRQTRKMLEIDWRGGRPVGTTSRQGLGYVR
jgi:hypothetical protein